MMAVAIALRPLADHRSAAVMVIGPSRLLRDRSANGKVFLGKTHIMHCGVLGQSIRVWFVMKCFSADLPERHSVCHTLSHSSPLHRMFGFAMPMFGTDKRSAFMNHWFHSCPHCFQRRASLFILASHHDLKEMDVSVSKTWTTFPKKRCSDHNKENANFVKTPDTWPKKLHKDSPPLPTQRPVGPDVETTGGHNFTLRDHRKAMLAAQFNHRKKEQTDDEFNTCTKCCLVNDADKKKIDGVNPGGASFASNFERGQ